MYEKAEKLNAILSLVTDVRRSFKCRLLYFGLETSSIHVSTYLQLALKTQMYCISTNQGNNCL
jgi:hypothetical protein